MRHLNAGNKLGVNGPQRKALLRGLTLAMLEHESIHTTRARAKELRWWADHVVTLAKRGDVAARRQIIQLLGSTQTFRVGENRVRKAIERLYSDIAPRFKDRSGGYTQIIRLAIARAGDCADMCIMRYLPPEEKKSESKDNKPGKKKIKSSDNKSEATAVVKAAAVEEPEKAEKKVVKKKSKASKET